jgi:hypothetical protein
MRDIGGVFRAVCAMFVAPVEQRKPFATSHATALVVFGEHHVMAHRIDDLLTVLAIARR